MPKSRVGVISPKLDWELKASAAARLGDTAIHE
jgi:hypothetical protein